MPKMISLFCGCGGGDIGFEQAGFDILSSFDIDPVCKKLYDAYFTRKLVQADLSKQYGLSDFQGIDFILASPPCQGFSTIGKRDFHDARNSLLFSAAQIISQLKPKMAIIENVKGAISGKHYLLWDNAAKHLRASGFVVETHVVCATEYGVPQTRSRVFMCAYRKGTMSPIQILTPRDKKSIYLRDILPMPHEAICNHQPIQLPVTSRDYRIATYIKPGMKLCDVRGGGRAIHSWDIPEVFGIVTEEEKIVLTTLMKARRQCRKRNFGDADPIAEDVLYSLLPHVHVKDLIKTLTEKKFVKKVNNCIDLTRTFNGKYKRAKMDGFAPTVDTRFGEPSMFLHPVEHRGYTVREAARIQTFPDAYNFDGNTSNMYRAIGNAVPPRIARLIGQNLIKNGL